MSSPQSRPGTFRHQVESVSRPLLVRLHQQPRLVVPIVTVVLVVVGVLAPVPVALVSLAVIFVFIAWIGYISWPAVPVGGRLMRIAMLALVVVLAGTRL